MPTNDPEDATVTQAALVEQLERQQEHICRLETLLQEAQRATPSKHEVVPAPGKQAGARTSTPTEQRPVVSLSHLSEWSGCIIAALLDKEDTGASLPISGKSEALPADEADDYEPTLSFDRNRLAWAHRCLAVGRRGTVGRSALMVLSVGVVALALVRWQQPPSVPLLSAPPVMQASAEPLRAVATPDIASPVPVVSPRFPRPTASPLPPRTISLARSVPRAALTPHRLATVPAVATLPVVATLPAVRLTQTKREEGRPASLSGAVASSSQRHAFATAQRPRIASADTRASASSRTHASFPPRPKRSPLQVATEEVADEERPQSPSAQASLSAAHTASPDYGLGSRRRTDASETGTRRETRTGAETHNDPQTNIDHAIQTLDKMRVLLADMEQRKRKASAKP